MYATMIREELARQGRLGVSPALVEAWMRLEHPTLDGLSRREFAHEVRVAVACIDRDPVASARLAESYGLERADRCECGAKRRPDGSFACARGGR